MATLLHIEASPRGELSWSSRIAAEFLDEYEAAHPDDQVKTLNVFDRDLPAFDGELVHAKYAVMHEERFTRAEADAWKKVVKLADEFKAADKYLISTPMWNFSIPYRLKQYIDLIVQPGLTFTYSQVDGYTGLVAGKPVLSIYARGGAYASGSGLEEYDFQKPYLKLVLAFIGFTDIRSIYAEPTLQAGPDVRDVAVKAAVELAQDAAAVF